MPSSTIARRVQRVALGLAAMATVGATVTVGVPTSLTAAHAATTVYATDAVNVRTGAGTDYRIIGVLSAGEGVTATGPSVNGWTPVSYNGQAAWVCSDYLRGGDTSAPAAPTGPAGSKVTTDYLNARTGAGVDYRVLKVLAPGTAVATTGATENGYAQITLDGGTAWVHTSWLADAGAAPVAPAPSAPSAPLPAPTVPQTTGSVFTTDALNIRSQPSTDNVPLGFVPAGTKLDTTGVTSGNWTQIVYTGAVRWVCSDYVSSAQSAPAITDPYYAGSQGLEDLSYNAHLALAAIRRDIPAAKTIYGVRWDGPGADHTTGHALDFMVYDNADLGWQVAKYLMAHTAEFNVKYIIWQQHIWIADDPGSGWQWMADRGSITQNHYDHVHLSVN